MKKKAFYTARIERDILDLVTKVSQNRGETKASFVRRAILKELALMNLLSPERMIGLGVPGGGN